MKRIIWIGVGLFFIMLAAGCASSKRSYQERQSLMLLNSYEQPRNKKHSKSYLKKAKKRHKKASRNRGRR